MRVIRKNFCIVSIMILVVFFENIILDSLKLDSLSHDDLITTFATIIVINFAIQIISLLCANIPIMSPVMLFIIFGYVFHFGQLLMSNVYEFDYLNYLDVYMFRDKDALITTLIISLNALNAVSVGALISTMIPRKSNHVEKIINDDTLEKQKCFVVGVTLFVISTPFRLIIDASQMIAAVRYGYAGAINALSLPGVFSAIAGFWYGAVLLMYVGKGNKKIFWACIAYAVLTMLSGNRGHQITNILIMVMIYVHVEQIRPSFSKVLKYGFLGYMMLIFIDVVMSFRSLGIEHFFSNFQMYFLQSFKSNILFETIGSFGETLYTPFLVIQQMGSQLNPFFGECLVYSIGTLIPDIGGITSYTNIASNFAKMIDTSNAIGGSFIGDLYYNFRSLYWAVAALFGYAFCRCSINYRICIEEHEFSKLIFYIPIFTNTLWWVRDAIGNEMRPLVWQIVFCMIILSLFSRKVKQ